MSGSAPLARTRLWRLGLELPPRAQVCAAFFLYAFSFGGFFPRLAELQRSMGVGEGVFGLALIGTAAGTLLTLTLGAPWIARLGSRHTLLGLLPLIPLGYVAATFVATPWAMFLCLFPSGLLIGAVEVAVNLEADRLEHALGERVMNRSHAFWSLGFFSAAGFGALMAHWQISPQANLILVFALDAVGSILLLGRFAPAALRASDQALHANAAAPVPLFCAPTPAILKILLVVLGAMVLEGAGFDWSAIYMRNVYAASPFLGGVAVALGAAAQALTRYFADGFVERYSPVLVARTLLAVLALRCLLVFAQSGIALSLLGFALMGVGTSVMFPLAMSAAARRNDRPAAVNVASMAQTAFGLYLLAPPLLGMVAQHFGVGWSFGIVLPMVLLGLLLVHALEPAPAP